MPVWGTFVSETQASEQQENLSVGLGNKWEKKKHDPRRGEENRGGEAVGPVLPAWK